MHIRPHDALIAAAAAAGVPCFCFTSAESSHSSLGTDSKRVQTAHEPSYLVKHLLADMPPVTERVKLMRKNQAPQSQSENNKRFEQSNVRTSAPAPALQAVQYNPARCQAALMCPPAAAAAGAGTD